MGKQLKILYFTVNQKNWVHEHREYFKAELAKIPDVHVQYLTTGGHITRILQEIDFTPDFIFFDDLNKTKPVTGLKNIHIPKGMLINDLHNKSRDKFPIVAQEYGLDVIFGFYRDAFQRTFPQFVRRFVWLPRHVNTQVFKDYGLNKDIDYLLMGAVNQKVYPVRDYIARTMENTKGFVRHKHPGYKHFTAEERKTALIGVNYAREINRAKIFFTDDSIYKYPISKYFEVPACNTLLLATTSAEIRDLGHQDGVTFVAITKRNFLERAKYYLVHEKERLSIAKRGYAMVRARHSTKVRVREFVGHVKQVLAGKIR